MLPLALYKVSAVELCCFATDPLTPLFEENAALLHRFEANLLTSLLCEFCSGYADVQGECRAVA